MSLNFLTNTTWLAPQIDFLLFLQSIRLHCGNILDSIFMSITILGEYFIPTLLSALVYWCIDTKKGIYLFSLCSFNVLLSQLFKMIACIYRPWILDPQIHPPKQAIMHAGSYSFPSGHTTMASSSLGGLAFLTRKQTLICISLILIISLIGFSRMFLGVHTPQDVLTGLLIGISLVFGLPPFIEWLEKDKKRYTKLLIMFNILVVLILYYISTKNYPVDYLNGKILVEPKKAIYISYISYGLSAGLINGVCLFKRFFDFQIDGIPLKIKLLRGFVGTICIWILFNFIIENLFKTQHNYISTFVITFFIGFFVTFLYPLTFKFLK